MKLLVLTSEPVSADQLRAALPADTDPSDAEVMVVAPALHKNALRFWFSDADEAIGKAERSSPRPSSSWGTKASRPAPIPARATRWKRSKTPCGPSTPTGS